MQESERDARKLIDGEWSSWGARGRMHKAYRQMQVTPEEEIPRYRKPRKNRKKHVHKWGEWIAEGEVQRRSWQHPRRIFTVYKWVRVCKRCGVRDRGESTVPSAKHLSLRRYHYYW